VSEIKPVAADLLGAKDVEADLERAAGASQGSSPSNRDNSDCSSSNSRAHLFKVTQISFVRK